MAASYTPPLSYLGVVVFSNRALPSVYGECYSWQYPGLFELLWRPIAQQLNLIHSIPKIERSFDGKIYKVGVPSPSFLDNPIKIYLNICMYFRNMLLY